MHAGERYICAFRCPLLLPFALKLSGVLRECQEPFVKMAGGKHSDTGSCASVSTFSPRKKKLSANDISAEPSATLLDLTSVIQRHYKML